MVLTLPFGAFGVVPATGDAPSGGMGSHYGFHGYCLSLFLWLERTGEAVVWDARGETAR